MLKSMRSNIKSLSWALWLVIIAFVGFIFVEWGAGRFSGEGESTSVINVGKMNVSGHDYQQQLTRTLESYKRQFEGAMNRGMISQLAIPEQVLQSMVQMLIIEQEAKKMKIRVSDEEIKKSIIEHPALQHEGAFIGSAEYKRLLAYNRIEAADFEASLRQEILANKLKDLLTQGLVLDHEFLAAEYSREKDGAELEMIVMQADPGQEVPEASEDELRSLHLQNQEAFMTPARRLADLVLIDKEAVKEEVRVEEAEISAYYRGHKEMFTVPGRRKVSRILLEYQPENRQEILDAADALAQELNRENFAEKARALSNDDKASTGGDWGYWEWRSFSGQEVKVIEGLSENTVSPPIDTGRAFSMLMVTENIPENQESYEDVRDRILSIITDEKINDLLEDRIQRWHRRLKGAKSLRAAAEKAGYPVISSGLLELNQSLSEIEDNGQISRQLFAMELNQVSEPVHFMNGMAVLQLTEIRPPEVMPFEQAQDQVAEFSRRRKRIELLTGRAENLVELWRSTGGEAGFIAMLEKENLSLEKTSYKRGDQLSTLPKKAGLDEMVFKLEPGSITGPLVFEDRLVLLRMVEKNLSTPDDLARDFAEFYARKAEETREKLFVSFLQERQPDYPIRLNNDLFNRIKERVLSRF